MPYREPPLAEFIDVLSDAATAATIDLDDADERPAAVQRIFDALSTGRGIAPVQPAALDVCRHLTASLATARSGPGPIAGLADAFAPLVPSLNWRLRPAEDGEDLNFRGGHANADIIGPAGLERHDDVVVGVSLLAPGVIYPDHSHPPEEIYVVMTEGEWFNEEAGWYTPGVGAVVYHRSDIVHAMRSANEPLLAIWCLRRP